ncbi:hypothetical protein CDAR_494441 [Caerostris darwini]|uniref:Uncharacterized protein n=1 Tax=Caerostris darwini TaxID=1538125 RepID=A0AAV4SJE3_9ARAC|nr:hypothetical protein CDAR_494441 [Caerostris darwini]
MGGQTVIQTGNDIAEATKHANPGSSPGRAMHPSWKEDACSCPSKQPESCLDLPDLQRVLQQNAGSFSRKGGLHKDEAEFLVGGFGEEKGFKSYSGGQTMPVMAESAMTETELVGLPMDATSCTKNMRHEIRSPLNSKNRGCPCKRESKSPFPFICFVHPPSARYFLPITEEEPRNSCPSKQPESCLDLPDLQRVLQQRQRIEPPSAPTPYPAPFAAPVPVMGHAGLEFATHLIPSKSQNYSLLRQIHTVLAFQEVKRAIHKRHRLMSPCPVLKTSHLQQLPARKTCVTVSSLPLKSKNRGCPIRARIKVSVPFHLFRPPSPARYFLPITEEEPRK